MCLNALWTKINIKQWLVDQPETIIAYKVATAQEKLYPPFYNMSEYYKRENTVPKIKETDKESICWNDDCSEKRIYYSYYYFFMKKKDANDLLKSLTKQYYHRGGKYRLLKCKIPKKSITEIGIQWIDDKDRDVIIATEFTILGQNKYLKEKETM